VRGAGGGSRVWGLSAGVEDYGIGVELVGDSAPYGKLVEL
jgi:hypothetical protein